MFLLRKSVFTKDAKNTIVMAVREKHKVARLLFVASVESHFLSVVCGLSLSVAGGTECLSTPGCPHTHGVAMRGGSDVKRFVGKFFTPL